MIKQLTKRPVTITGVQWTGNVNQAEVEEFVGKKLEAVLESETAYEAGQGPPLFSLIIPTYEGDMKAMPGDWVLKGVEGEFYPCRSSVIEKSYDIID